MTGTEFDDLAVAAVYQSWPASVRVRLLKLRDLIFETASEIEDAAPLDESLKWGEPSYLAKGKMGTAIRLAPTKEAGQYGLFVHCQTSLIAEFRETRPDAFTYGGSRALLFEEGEEPDKQALRDFIAAALTYHARKKSH